MANKDYDMTGLMYRNPNRESDKHPEFTGTITIDGQDYWLSAWVNERKPGSKIPAEKYFSLKFKPKEARNAAPAKRPSRSSDSGPGGIDSDLPFAPIGRGIGGHVI